jgi:cysteine desulfurase
MEEIGLMISKENTFYLTSSAKEALHHILFASWLDLVREKGRNHVLLISGALPKYAEAFGYVTKKITLNERGLLTRALLEQAAGPRSAILILSLPWADPLTGVIQPIEEIAAFCLEREIRLHVDASHVAGSLPFRFQDLPIDILSVELQGEGCGIAAKKGLLLPSLESQAEAVSFEASLRQLLNQCDYRNTETVRLREHFIERIQAKWPQAVVLFTDVHRLPDRCVIALPGVSAEALRYLLHKQRVAVHPLSSLMLGCHIDPTLAHTAISYRFADDATEEECDRIADKIIAAADRLRAISGALAT